MKLNLLLGKTYWVIENGDFETEIGKPTMERLIECTFTKLNFSKYDRQISYLFTPSNSKDGLLDIIIDENYVDVSVFDTIDKYLRYMVGMIDELNGLAIGPGDYGEQYVFDDYFKNEISKSQEKYPEIWV